MFDRKKFFAALRSRASGVFGTSLSQPQVQGVDAILDEGLRRRTPLVHMAYVLATAYHETGGKIQPVRENLNYSVSGLLKTFGRHRISAADARKYGRSGARKADQMGIANIIYGGEWGRNNLGNIKPGDGWRFRGGGLPQTTGRRNFTILGLVDKPDLVTDLKTSVRMMFDAMEQGVFTGKRLDDYTDYLSMRRIINGTDKAEKIAGEAEAFERALRVAHWGLNSVLQPEPTEHDSILRVGSKSAYVRELQTNLKAIGYAVAIDGDFGTGTEAAVKAFQTSAGIKPDGWAGPRTLDALGRAVADIKAKPKIEKAAEDAKGKAAEQVEKKTGLWGWLTGLVGSGGLGLGWLGGMDWQTVVAVGGLVLVFLVIIIVMRRQIIGAVKDIKSAVEGGA